MAVLDRARTNVEIKCDGSLRTLVDPLRRALARRPFFYKVDVAPLGGVGEVLVSITGSRGHLPLILSPQDLESGDVFRVVADTMERFGL
jgi:hypothetical protein